jgi:hypothetical protein
MPPGLSPSLESLWLFTLMASFFIAKLWMNMLNPSDVYLLS